MNDPSSRNLAFFQDFFRVAKTIDRQISVVMLIFLLFLDQILGEVSKEGEGAGLILEERKNWV